MKKLFILDGAIRPSKSAIIKYITEDLESNRISGIFKGRIIRKITTKQPSMDSNKYLDYSYKTISDFEREISENDGRDWITYGYAKRDYAIKKSTISDVLARSENAFVIARNIEAIKSIKHFCEDCISKELKEYIKVVVVYVYTEQKTIIECKELDAPTQMKHINESLKDFHRSVGSQDNIYNDIIVYTGDDDFLKQQLENLLRKYGGVSDVVPRKCFFIHSYKDKQKADRHVSVLKGLEKDTGLNFVSLFNSYGAYVISDEVFENIHKSEYFICDITPDRGIKNKLTASPNIWLELGYAISFIKLQKKELKDKLLLICDQKMAKKVTPSYTDTFIDLPSNITYYSEKNFQEEIKKAVIGLINKP